MTELKMPEINSIMIAGNLTKAPIFRETTNGAPVVNFHIASNRRYKDNSSLWQEDVCYIGIVAWNKLAESCRSRLQKGSAVLVEGELQSRSFKTDDGKNRTIVEIKAKKIQFLNKLSRKKSHSNESQSENSNHSEPSSLSSYDDSSFEKFLSDEESDLIND